MISNQVLQTTIDGLRSIARVDLCVVDVDGKMIATTSEEMSNCLGAAQDFSRSPADSQEVQGYQFFKIFDEAQLEYILVIGGSGEDVYMIGKMVAFQIQSLLVAYKERFDKDNFIKNLLLDNLLLVDNLQQGEEASYSHGRVQSRADHRIGEQQGQQCPGTDARQLWQQ